MSTTICGSNHHYSQPKNQEPHLWHQYVKNRQTRRGTLHQPNLWRHERQRHGDWQPIKQWRQYIVETWRELDTHPSYGPSFRNEHHSIILQPTTTYYSLRSYLHSRSQTQLKMNKTTTTTPKMKLKCTTCGRSFAKIHNLKRHVVSKHMNNPIVYRCTMCDKNINRLDNYLAHCRRIHGFAKECPPPLKTFYDPLKEATKPITTRPWEACTIIKPGQKPIFKIVPGKPKYNQITTTTNTRPKSKETLQHIQHPVLEPLTNPADLIYDLYLSSDEDDDQDIISVHQSNHSFKTNSETSVSEQLPLEDWLILDEWPQVSHY